MKNNIFSLFAIVALLFAFSCKKMENSERWRNLPDIEIVNVENATGNIILLQGRCRVDGVSYRSSDCGYFFLCSSDGKTFSKSEIKTEYDSKKSRYTGIYVPSADGTYYFKFCAVSKGRYSYIESEVKAVEYVKVSPAASEAVDLGLSVKWATCNVGASNPEEYGDYYQWAGTKDVSSTSIYLDWDNCPYHTGTDWKTGWTKYNIDSSYGTVDKKKVLEPNDDAAHVHWGGSWRMPTDAEWIELRENCTWTWTQQNGVNGYKVASKKSGYTSSFIFLPAAGYRNYDSLINADATGFYWSSSLEPIGGPSIAWGVSVKSNEVYMCVDNRYRGNSIRPVCE